MGTRTEINKRRTFAIISHPDAGKTTLTEKLLLFGGAIQTAGAVKSNKIKKGAASDFMDIERQRGISVATSVMAFEYQNTLVNLLDTPGHKDFAEDTYRTLTAVDSVILVIDCQKGVEEQTEKLMKVCRMRDTPVIIFVNKLDRPGRDPFELLDELESKLDIAIRPLSWPVGMGKDFKGVMDMESKNLLLFDANIQKVEDDIVEINGLDDPKLDEELGLKANELREEIELVEGVYGEFEPGAYRKAKVAPIFFGSALYNFGVKELIEKFIQIAPTPQPRPTTDGFVDPKGKEFTGFVFKIHANIDPRHRDRIAFLRVCSGKFERNKFYKHVRLGKRLRFSNPVAFMAQRKSLVEEAFPGDVIGLYDTGNFKIGDALTEGSEVTFRGIPTFSPEIFKELINDNPMKTKQLDKGIKQLTEEGVAQLFIQQPGNRKIIGTVGDLQFEVIKYRLEHEYGASCHFIPLNYYNATWITSEDEAELERFINLKPRYICRDKDDNAVFLAGSEWTLNTERQNYPMITFHATSEFKTERIKT